MVTTCMLSLYLPITVIIFILINPSTNSFFSAQKLNFFSLLRERRRELSWAMAGAAIFPFISSMNCPGQPAEQFIGFHSFTYRASAWSPVHFVSATDAPFNLLFIPVELPLGVAFTSFSLFLLLYWIGIVSCCCCWLLWAEPLAASRP